MAKSFMDKYSDSFYFIFRVAVGLLFMQHGIQKLFGGLGGTKVESLVSLFGLAGIIEFFGGILIALGLFTRFLAFISGAEMVGAWFIAHAKQGWIPIINLGELALLYLACFLVILSQGPGIYALDNLFEKKR
ncbi:DoxX family protein [Candidatus Pacearchaeota archaeon]|nr:DoxX family protein [Candidatus Pacearchaeota archaeon]